MFYSCFFFFFFFKQKTAYEMSLRDWSSDVCSSDLCQWDEAEQLKEIANKIQELRAEFGQPNAQVDRFLHYCSIRGSNVPGEPKLAKALLDEILKEKANLPDKADKATSC